MLLFTALYLVSFSATGETLNGKVVAAPDANTIIVLDNDYLRQKVTLKSVHMPKGKAVLAGIAQQFLWTLLHGKPVRVEWQSWDKYGRRVGRIFLEDKDVALVFLREGFARVNTSRSTQDNSVELESYLLAEQEARGQGLGVWRESILMRGREANPQ